MPRWSLVAVYLLITLTFVVTASWSHDASSRATELAMKLDLDAKARVEESCIGSKIRYAAAITSLTRTYAFLEESTPEERKSTINRFIRAGLNKQEQDVQGLRPASFCDGIGPSSPAVPKRPRSI